MGNWENGGSNICELHQKRSSCIETKGSASPNLIEHEDSRELGMKRYGEMTKSGIVCRKKKEKKPESTQPPCEYKERYSFWLRNTLIVVINQKRSVYDWVRPCRRHATEWLSFACFHLNQSQRKLYICQSVLLRASCFWCYFLHPRRIPSYNWPRVSVIERSSCLIMAHDSFSNLKRLIQPQIQILQLDYTQILFIENSIFILDGTPLIHRIFSIDIEYVAEWGTWEYYFHSRTQRHSTCMFPLSTIILNSDSREGVLRSLLKVWWSRQL